MINTAARLWFAIAAVAGVTTVAYAALVGDRAGWLLFVSLLVAATLTGLAVAGSGAVDRAPATGPGAPPPASVVVGPAAAPAPSNWPLAMAVAATIAAVGVALGTPLVVAGLIAALLASAGWCAQAWREHPSWTPSVGARVADRLVTPVTLPIAAVVLVATVVICVSRVLLAVDEKAAVAVALVVAIVVLAAFAFVASKPRSNTTLLGTMAGVAFLALAGAGVAGAAKGERTFEPAREPTTEAFSLVAKGTKFNKDALTVPAGKPFTVNFTNEDSGTYHNVAIWTEKAGGKPVMNGEPIKGVEKLRYTFEIRDPGTYAFRCDFHANMVGTVNAE